MKTFATALAAFVVATAAHSAMPTAKDLRQAQFYWQTGQRALQSGNAAKAKEQFEKALTIVPDFPEAHIGLGLLAMGEKDDPGALAHFEKARDGYQTLGVAMQDIEMDRYRESRDQMTRIRDQIAQLRTPTSRSALNEANVEQRVQALETDYRRLEAMEQPKAGSAPEVPGEVYFHIGNALFHLGRIPEAVTAWETCASRSPKFALVHNNLALAYWKVGRLEDAKASLAKAEGLGMKVNPQFKADLEKAASAAP